MEVGASKGDREGTTKEVGGRPGEGCDDPGAENREMNSYMLLRSKEGVARYLRTRRVLDKCSLALVVGERKQGEDLRQEEETIPSRSWAIKRSREIG